MAADWLWQYPALRDADAYASGKELHASGGAVTCTTDDFLPLHYGITALLALYQQHTSVTPVAPPQLSLRQTQNCV